MQVIATIRLPIKLFGRGKNIGRRLRYGIILEHVEERRRVRSF